MSEPLAKIDSGVEGLSISPPKEDASKKGAAKKGKAAAKDDAVKDEAAKDAPKDAPKDDAKAAKEEAKAAKRRASTMADAGVFRIEDLEEQGKEIVLAPETQKTGWKINTSPSTIDEKEILKKFLTTPPIKKIELQFPLGLKVPARNLKGVTIKDALDAIHKAYKKKEDDELDMPYLKGFEWDPKESWGTMLVHLSKDAGVTASKSSKKKNKKDADE